MTIDDTVVLSETQFPFMSFLIVVWYLERCIPECRAKSTGNAEFQLEVGLLLIHWTRSFSLFDL